MDQSTRPLRRRLEKAKPVAAAWWTNWLKEHPLGAASAAASIAGGSMLLALFCQIGGMPDLDLAGASAILMAMAALGTIFSIGLAGCAFGMGLVMWGSEQSLQALNEPKTLLLLSTPGLATATAAALSWEFLPRLRLSGIFWELPIAVSACLAVWVYARRGAPATDAVAPEAPRMGRGPYALAFGLAAFVWTAIALSAMLTFIALYPRDGDPNWFSIKMILWTTWCYGANATVASAKRNPFAVVAVVGAASLAALMALSGNWGGLSAAVVRALGQGDMPVALVLSADGCDQLNKAAGGRTVCRLGPADKTAVACPVMLRSRIGSPFYVELSAYDHDGRWPQPHPPARLSAIAIDKKEVKSWSRLAPMAAASAASASGERASSGVVTFLDPAPARSWLAEQCGAAPTPSATPSA